MRAIDPRPTEGQARVQSPGLPSFVSVHARPIVANEVLLIGDFQWSRDTHHMVKEPWAFCLEQNDRIVCAAAHKLHMGWRLHYIHGTWVVHVSTLINHTGDAVKAMTEHMLHLYNGGAVGKLLTNPPIYTREVEIPDNPS